MMTPTVTAIVLGIVEGLTEFLPVSSTGHLILATKILGFDAEQWATFNVVIQIGAIAAVVVQFWRTFWAVFQGLLRLDKVAIRFVVNILVAFMPAVVLGLLFKKQIEANLGNAMIVAWALLIGGIAILVIERIAKTGEYKGIGQLPVIQAFGVGCMQCLAMIPGVSRSGATIMGALLMGIERRTAAEFSFFLAVPTMLGATTLELWGARHALAAGTMPVGWGVIGLGTLVSFVVALVVIKGFVAYVSKSGFAPFAFYRIIVGVLAISLLMHAAG
jgi:undecaprenyl-diphosphatase